MGSLILLLLLGLGVFVLGNKIGISLLADILLYKGKISTREHKYYKSWRCVKKLLRNDYGDT